MDVNIYLLCHNEQVLLPHTINHYKRVLPNAKVTIYDNYSTDNSVALAHSLGCMVVPFSTDDILNEHTQTWLKNNVWKAVETGWVIMADMDEWLHVTHEDLAREYASGTSILSVNGRDMIGESQLVDLSDIDLHAITKYVDNAHESKHLCFLREKMSDMNYSAGAHQCAPIGEVIFSSMHYYNFHMTTLGLPFMINKMQKRYERTAFMRTLGMAIHYTDNVDAIRQQYHDCLHRSS